MYIIAEREDVIRIPPERLREDYDAVVTKLTRQTVEGKVVGERSMILLATNVKPAGHGRIVHGDGAVYQNVRYDALIFRVDNQEVIEGTVCEVLKFGAFVRFGPLDGLLHISQVMDDHIDVDEGGQRLVGKETKRDIKINHRLRARVVSVSMNERNPRESKIGLTMRQPGLGRSEWLEEALAKAKKDPKQKKEGKE